MVAILQSRVLLGVYALLVKGTGRQLPLQYCKTSLYHDQQGGVNSICARKQKKLVFEGDKI